jgi:hypothetical protein
MKFTVQLLFQSHHFQCTSICSVSLSKQVVINFGLIMENQTCLPVNDQLMSELIMLAENEHNPRIIMTQMVS